MHYKVKGTYDLLPNDSVKWQYVSRKLASIFSRYNYHEIRTPIMEYSSNSPPRWIFWYGSKRNI